MKNYIMKNYITTNSNIYLEAKRRLCELESIKEQIISFLQNSPSGKIYTANNKGTIQFYVRNKIAKNELMCWHNEYVSKKSTDKLKPYIQKSYYESELKLLDLEIEGLKNLVTNCSDIPTRIRNIYSNKNDEIKKLINPIDISDEDYIRLWKSQKYIGKQISDFTTTYETASGEKVRSKSELNIANALAKANIPYRYEYPLLLKDGRTIYPDFTTLDIKNRKIKYWEHRGMMDDREYSRDSVSRLRLMLDNGIVLGDNLIISEETSSLPLSTKDINAIIQAYY